MEINPETVSALGLTEEYRGVSRSSPRVLSLLSSFLERSIQKNDRKFLVGSKRKDAITIFHGSKPPPLSIRHYVERIFKYARCSTSCFVVGYVYMDRFLGRTDSLLTSLNIHRLLITSIMVAAKFLDDDFYNNAYYAKVGGVGNAEMNRMEMKFLFSLDFRLYVAVEVFRNYCLKLETECGCAHPTELPIHGSHIKEGQQSNDDIQHSLSIAGYNCRAM